MIPVVIILICIIVISLCDFRKKEKPRIKKINKLLPIDDAENNLFLKLKNLLNEK